MQTSVVISSNPLDVATAASWLLSPECGGVDIFVGTVRNNTNGRSVVRLEFEAYEKMALSEMEKLASHAFANWPLQKVLIHHRVGSLAVGGIPVIIGAAAAHRDAAFDACRYLIDRLKQTVPIWKKEVFEDGEYWVAAHP